MKVAVVCDFLTYMPILTSRVPLLSTQMAPAVQKFYGTNISIGRSLVYENILGRFAP